MEGKYYYWLHNVSGIGKETRKKLLEIATPKELFEGSLEKVKSILNKTQYNYLEESKQKWKLEEEWKRLQEGNIRFSYYGGKEYPGKFMEIPDPPFCVYQKGKEECFHKPAVAVVGARNCSAYGGLAAKELGKELANRGIVVVSGMARGVDGICQWAALEQGGESIGVLGSGVEVCYPRENSLLYERLQKHGCLISENPPFTQPKAGLFPRRNRMISGLADILVVVEAREKSGTLITVDMALEQGKEVYAFPGRITDRDSVGCNRLIKQGAGVILSPKEFVEEICPMLQVEYQNKGKQIEKKEDYNLTREEKNVLSVVGIEPEGLEEIYGKIRKKIPLITLGETMEILLVLRMKQLVKEYDGTYFGLNQLDKL